MLTVIILTTLIIGGGLYLLMRHDRKQAAKRMQSVAERIQREEQERAQAWASETTKP